MKVQCVLSMFLLSVQIYNSNGQNTVVFVLMLVVWFSRESIGCRDSQIGGYGLFVLFRLGVSKLFFFRDLVLFVSVFFIKCMYLWKQIGY